MTFTRRTLLGLLTCNFVTPAFAGQPQVFATNGVAIQGYDPVEYIDQRGPIQGNTKHSSDWNGARWLFSSAQNKARFDANPRAFAPQYGGYCAYAVSKGAIAPTDPTAWSVVAGKLYLNFSPAVRKIWRSDILGNISKADDNWPDVLN